MTIEEKNKILKLRDEGKSYGEISTITGISRSSISSLLSRKADKINSETCKNCGTILKMVPGKKKKSFCCDSCRYEWWNNKRKSMGGNNGR